MEISSQRYLAHLDILGMRALMVRDHREAWLLSALEIALTRSTSITIVSEGIDDPIHIPELVKSVGFSDTIVLYTDTDSPRDFHAIFTAALNLFSKALHLRDEVCFYQDVYCRFALPIVARQEDSHVITTKNFQTKSNLFWSIYYEQ